MDEYSRLKELELADALRETQDDLASGLYQEGSVEDHIKRILS